MQMTQQQALWTRDEGIRRAGSEQFKALIQSSGLDGQAFARCRCLETGN